MNANDAIRTTMSLSAMVLDSYFHDFNDEELLRRPGPGCNHLAWQLGHLIASECGLLNSLCPGAAPSLPTGFEEHHAKENKDSNDPKHFCTVAEYQALFEKVRGASEKTLALQSAADFDQPAPEKWRKMFPTAGAVWCLIATHGMMHAGQFVPVRRALGKPVKI
ncbi:MAG: DinB family protein [Pirellulales bacterium]|nr:DinB family protein [Pirellulales bacterium]